ncbi:cystatin-B-like [Mobula birostris]|uniref:cystatin-B-like n=1 Tax=Mobula birostris TaxID=1983395 RepID=UPI003B28BB8E
MTSQGTAGSMAKAIEANAEIQAIADVVKTAVQEKLGRELQVYQAKLYCSQVEARTIYFIKILTGSRDECIHVKVIVSLPQFGGDTSLHGIEDHKKLCGPITYFWSPSVDDNAVSYDCGLGFSAGSRRRDGEDGGRAERLWSITLGGPEP